MDELIDRALAEDVGDGDLTTRILVPLDLRATARIVQKEPGVIAGLDVAAAVFARFDVRLEPDDHAVARLEGPAAGILTAERTALNFLGRLSGIATLTARYVGAIEGTGARILDTRKTTPGLRELEKAAVVAGGGTNHRMGLHDAVMIKENHAAAAGGLAAATRRAVAEAPEGVEVCVECETPEDVDIALDAGARRLLLDNMPPAELVECVARSGGRATLEASGGITLDNVREVAETGVDFISIGALTHSAPALDLSLLFD
ncbi:MAG TPA: carboxylating nicotinate-nucleotide diphosphorylase [Thermoleophilaceae bacterium]|nr:carboxylating nicotinate-nucleotide diphosphorylase [Thermoleophilaceae bacterium]